MMIIQRTFSRMRSFVQQREHFKRNLHKAATLKPIATTALADGLVIKGCTPELYAKFERFYLSQERTKPDYLRWHGPMLKALSDKLIFLIGREQDSGFEILGVAVHYFNERDAQESTIHESYIGMAPGMRGQGIGTKLRNATIAHYHQCGLHGISSKITITNVASRVSAEKSGFKVIEEFFDPQFGFNRYYLVRCFSDLPPAANSQQPCSATANNDIHGGLQPSAA